MRLDRDGGHGKPYLYQRMRPHLCPGCTARILEMNPAPCAICGRENPITASSSRAKMHPIARQMRVLLAPLGRGFHILTALFCFFVLWAMVLHGITPLFETIVLGLAVFSIWSIRLATRAAVYLFAPATRQTPRPGLKSFLVLPVCLAVLALLNRFDVPLRAGFWLHRSALQEVAQSAFQARGVQTTPTRAGLFRVEQIDLTGNSARIEVTSKEFFSGTKAGFALCPQGCATAKFPSAWMDWSHPTSYKKLSEDWYWWEESGSNF